MTYSLNNYSLQQTDRQEFRLVPKDFSSGHIEISYNLYLIIDALISDNPFKVNNGICIIQGHIFTERFITDTTNFLLQTNLIVPIKSSPPDPTTKISPHSDEQKISIILVNYNNPDDTIECVESILKSIYENFEIILVENGSTRENADKVADQFGRTPSIKLLKSSENLGFSGGNNLGISASTGELIFILNNDTIIKENTLSQIATHFSQFPDTIAAPKIMFKSFPQFINGIGNAISLDNWGSDNAIGHLDFGQFDGIKTIPSACFAAVVIPRKIMVDVGRLNEKIYFMYYEDIDWCFRAFIKGHRIHVLHDALVFHAFNATSKGTDKKWMWLVQGRLSFAILYLRHRLLARVLYNYFKQDCSVVLSAIKQKEYSLMFYYFKGYWKLLLLLPRLVIYRYFNIRDKRKNNLDEMQFIQSTFPPPLMKENGPFLNHHLLKSYIFHFFKLD